MSGAKRPISLDKVTAQQRQVYELFANAFIVPMEKKVRNPLSSLGSEQRLLMANFLVRPPARPPALFPAHCTLPSDRSDDEPSPAHRPLPVHAQDFVDAHRASNIAYAAWTRPEDKDIARWIRESERAFEHVEFAYNTAQLRHALSPPPAR